MAGKRPEYSNPPDQYYNENEARKYSSNSHIIKVQSELSKRAYDLLELKDNKPCVLLDIGCGSGLSGEILSQNGHIWVGVDISKDMLKVAKEENETEGDLILMDIGKGLPFKPGVFDGAISISAIQWLCHSNTSNENPAKRLFFFFQMLYACLVRNARAVFQFYPENQKQCELICNQAIKAGFRGGIIVDFPNSKKTKKIFLVINAGAEAVTSPKPLITCNNAIDMNHIKVEDRFTGYRNNRKKSQKPIKSSKSYIEARKERMRKRGFDVRESTKYTGRKRRH